MHAKKHFSFYPKPTSIGLGMTHLALEEPALPCFKRLTSLNVGCGCLYHGSVQVGKAGNEYFSSLAIEVCILLNTKHCACILYMPGHDKGP